MVDLERTLTYEQDDRYVLFKVERPPLTQVEARSLPSLRHAGLGGGIDISAPNGVWQTEESSVFGFERWAFGFMGVKEYAHMAAGRIGATLVEPDQIEGAPSL